MNDFKATPEQWKADKYDWSKADTEAMECDSAFRCILELRSRIEQLEAQASNYPAIPDSSTPPSVATDQELSGLWLAKGSRAIYDLGIEHGQASSQKVADSAPVAPSLKEQGLEALEEVVKLTETTIPRADVIGSAYQIKRSSKIRELKSCIDTIRRALEALPND